MSAWTGTAEVSDDEPTDLFVQLSGLTLLVSAASGNVRPVHDLAQTLVLGVLVPPDDVAADHAALFLVAGVVGAIEGEVTQCGELGSMRLGQEPLVGV
jgi:hypothetical protein